jgi:hypothetical protein
MIKNIISIFRKNKKGIMSIYFLIFAGIFIIMFSGLLRFILMQLRQTTEKAAWSQSLNIAEAGINYYRWCINNDVAQDCLMQKDYFDSTGQKVGAFSLQASSTMACGQSIKTDIISTGWTDKFSSVKRKISVLYARTSVAKYAYILKDSVWIGADHEIRGPYQSNGGIRMDGSNQSLVSSAQQEWNCTSTFGCSPCPTSNGCHVQSSLCMCPGVFTTTANSNTGLFDFPVIPFDFDGITVDLALIKSTASSSGVYLPPATTTNPQAKGYHIKFQSNGTFEAWIVTSTSPTSAYSLEDDWHNDYFTIAKEYLYRTYNIPSSCSAIFVEDNIWVEGTIKGRITLASANLITSNVNTDVVLPGSIDYTTTTGADAFALISQRNVLIGPQSPDQMILRGIFTAQKGRFGRNCYVGNTKTRLEIYGSIISKGRVGTQWSGGSCDGSGYTNRETYYDTNLIYNPPSFVPYIDPEFRIIDWNEMR